MAQKTNVLFPLASQAKLSGQGLYKVHLLLVGQMASLSLRPRGASVAPWKNSQVNRELGAIWALYKAFVVNMFTFFSLAGLITIKYFVLSLAL